MLTLHLVSKYHLQIMQIQGYNRVLEKLSLKKDRIRDIQDAIQSADLNHDKQLDWEEWRLDLKMFVN